VIMGRMFRGHNSKTWYKEKGIVLPAVFLLVILCCLPSVSYALRIDSRAAVVMEASTGRILYGKSPALRLPPASTAKLMTAMVVLDMADPRMTVTISERASSSSRVIAHFRAGEKATIETLLHAALIKSANDAAIALAEAVGGTEESFVKLMNEKAFALSMLNTRFVNATGLPGRGQYITGYDLAKMLRHALRYPMIREIINIKASRILTEDGRPLLVKNSNRLLWSDGSVLGGKTGYTKAAKHCFVCASKQGSETVIVALLGTPSRERMWKESRALFEKGFAIVGETEDQVAYTTRPDYRAYLRPASYTKGTSHDKRLPEEKIQEKVKKTKAGQASQVQKKLKQMNKANTEARRGSGVKG
jgi:D-alanyl-D-alanine carboxypeptidase (penicillin-binding protein 5/6)